MATPSAGAQACTGCGAAVVMLTDLPGDFLSYLVKIVSLQLKRADGTVIETVPVATQVDFSQLVNLSEIISAKQVPAGRYVGATLTLDYAGATITVDNGSGGVTIAPDQLINGTTSLSLSAPNPTQMTLSLSLSPGNELVVSPGAVANLALDFNLLASNAVAPSPTSPTTVTVNPVLTASLVPDATKSLRVRGALVSANASSSTYTVTVRPFHDADDTAGQLTITTTDATAWSINGTAFMGAAGLSQLAMLPAGTVTAAYGTWVRATQSFTASSVLVGSSVAGTASDGIEGTVISRSGSTFTVANGLVSRHGYDGMSFDRQVDVTVGPSTTVTEDGPSGTFSIADISVGQRIQVSGVLASGSGGGNATLDATAGSARLMLTGLLGTVTSMSTGQITLNLLSLDGRAPANFNFAGTGSTQDATASAYTVAVPMALPTAGIVAGLPTRFFGFVAPFGQAPPDFSAVTLLNYAQTRALLQVRWTAAGVSSPFAIETATELLLSQTTLQGSVQHVIRIGPSLLDPSTLSAGLQIVPDTAAANPQFAVGHWQSRTIDTFGSFSDFVTALSGDLNGTVSAVQVLADGPYNAVTGVLSADQAILILNN